MYQPHYKYPVSGFSFIKMDTSTLINIIHIIKKLQGWAVTLKLKRKKVPSGIAKRVIKTYVGLMFS